MSKNDSLILTIAVTVMLLFLLNFFITAPSISGYNENMLTVDELNAELSALMENIARGEELKSEIERLDIQFAEAEIKRYNDENYSIHNFFVDSASSYGLAVESLAMSDVAPIGNMSTEGESELILQDALVAGQMTVEEIDEIPTHYEPVSQTTSILVTGSRENILNYIDAVARDNLYVSVPSLSLSGVDDIFSAEESFSTSLQFVEYMYRENPEQTSAGDEPIS